jgi:hypothetical protein
MGARLDSCEEFSDVFALVKKTAEISLGCRRSGLMLYLARLPQNIGAFHAMGTNGIVMNRNALDVVTRGTGSLREINAYVYSTLLHEYLHALGYVDERDVRRLVYHISLDSFGVDHPATKLASRGPNTLLQDPRRTKTSLDLNVDVEVIPDLEKSSRNYIS